LQDTKTTAATMRNETEVRAELIDPLLLQQGWAVVPNSRVRREFPITKGRLIGVNKRKHPDKADYILQYNNRNVAVIEAKAENCYYTQGLAQAKDYAERLHIRFAIATNGNKYYIADLQGTEGDIETIPTPEELWQKLFPPQEQQKPAFNWEQLFHNIPFETKGGTWELRYYQQNAINAVMHAVANDQKRMLLTLATGTGKTAIAFQIAWKLFHAKWNINKDGKRSPRILFLADRNILASQAFNSFNAFEEEALVRISPKEINKKGKVPKNGSLFFTIFQTFMSGNFNTDSTEELIEEENAISYEGAAEAPSVYNRQPSMNFGQYPRDFFDFIIIDECHRGGANDESSWRAILEYFEPATQLGLTATPKRDVNGDTYKYFGEPIYVYSLKQGINDGFLTPFRVKQILTNLDEYIYTEDDTVIDGEIQAGKEYKEGDFNRTIKIDAREQFRVKDFLSKINQNEKTLVFCATQDHAAQVRDLINQYADAKNPNYCQRVTASDGALGEQYLRQFQNNELKLPVILTTSQKLSTGVDAPEIRNIVLLRPINSMIEFKQIIGRGTRLYDGKYYFTVYDFVKAYKHFSDPAWDGEPLEPEEPVTRPAIQPCNTCGCRPCECEKPAKEPCEMCGYIECRCEAKVKNVVHVKLADGKVRQLQSITTTSFWTPDGKPMTAQEFLEVLYGKLPTFFTSEDDLKQQWSEPASRRKLLENLSLQGFEIDQLREFQKVLDAENSDLYDVLSYVAYNSDILDRKTRVQKVQPEVAKLEPAYQDFLQFVLQQYEHKGIEELDDAKLGAYLQLKYNSIQDAKPILGDLQNVRHNFINIQRYLYI
jgi:type I restriction enzyme R subunit